MKQEGGRVQAWLGLPLPLQPSWQITHLNKRSDFGLQLDPTTGVTTGYHRWDLGFVSLSLAKAAPPTLCSQDYGT